MATSRPIDSDSDQPYRTEVDLSGSSSLAVTILHALASRDGVDPAELGLDIYEHIDADALEQLAQHTETTEGVTWTFEFLVEERRVTVSSDGCLEIT